MQVSIARILYLLVASFFATDAIASSGTLRPATARANAMRRSPSSLLRTSASIPDDSSDSPFSIVSFAIVPPVLNADSHDARIVLSPGFTRAGRSVYTFSPKRPEQNLPRQRQ